MHERRKPGPGASKRAIRNNIAAPNPASGSGTNGNQGGGGEVVGETPSVAGKPEPWKGSLVTYDGELILLGGAVDFSSDHLQVDDKSKSVLDEVATMLEARPGLTRVEVQAHVDARASGDHAKATQLRAETVRTYLVSAGVDASRVVAKGYGSDVPIDTNRTEEGRKANRRVEIVVRSVNGKDV